MDEISSLRKIALTPDGKRFHYGAQSRLAEYTGLSRSAIKNILLGDWTFGEAKMPIVRAIIKNKSGRFPLCNRRPPGRPRKNKCCQ